MLGPRGTEGATAVCAPRHWSLFLLGYMGQEALAATPIRSIFNTTKCSEDTIKPLVLVHSKRFCASDVLLQMSSVVGISGH